jgi:hypothetical protein
MIGVIDPAQVLIDQLFSDAEVRGKCPFVKRDRSGAYCGKGFVGRSVSEERRNVCNIDSLQSWCLGGHYRDCVFYNGIESVE